MRNVHKNINRNHAVVDVSYTRLRANLTSVASRHCCYPSASLIANSRRSRRATVAHKCWSFRQHIDENSNFCGMKSCNYTVFDLLAKNAMSALSFSSVQYLSGVKLNGDASIFVVALQSFLYAAHRSHDPRSRLWLDDSRVIIHIAQ